MTCSLRKKPDSWRPDGFTTFDEYLSWEPCPAPVTLVVREPFAPGGNLRLCSEHATKIRATLLSPGVQDEALRKIEERLSNASAGPWFTGRADDEYGIPILRNISEGSNERLAEGVYRPQNADFIARAPEDVKVLLAEVRRLQREVEALRAEGGR